LELEVFVSSTIIQVYSLTNNV